MKRLGWQSRKTQSPFAVFGLDHRYAQANFYWKIQDPEGPLSMRLDDKGHQSLWLFIWALKNSGWLNLRLISNSNTLGQLIPSGNFWNDAIECGLFSQDKGSPKSALRADDLVFRRMKNVREYFVCLLRLKKKAGSFWKSRPEILRRLYYWPARKIALLSTSFPLSQKPRKIGLSTK